MSPLRCSLLALVALSACDPAAPEAPGADLVASRSTEGAAPAIADGVDAADRACQIMLRSAQRLTDSEGEPQLTCEDGRCAYTWTVTVDVATTLVDAGATAGLLYRAGDASDWRQVDAAPQAASPNGYTRFTLVIGDHLPGPDAEQAVELIPFARTAQGERLFEHNVHQGDVENYWLRPEDGYGLWGDSYICTHLVDQASVGFGREGAPYLVGDLRVGNALTVNYDLERLPECRNTHNGAPAWDTTANLRFLPSGELLTQSVRAFVSDYGRPTTESYAVPMTVAVPPGTEAVELWFQNASGAGSTCSTWDSNYGANYHFDVKPVPADDPCWGVQTWQDQHTNTPSCPSYTVDEQYDAAYCELYADAVGLGFEGHYGIPYRWLEAWVHVGPQAGQVRGVGLYAATRDRTDGSERERWSFGAEVEPDRWKTGLTTQFSGYMGQGSYLYEVERFAFFVDVQRPDGRVVRLWQSRGGANYSLDDAFALPTSAWPIPYGRVDYANPDAGVFDALRVCGGR